MGKFLFWVIVCTMWPLGTNAAMLSEIALPPQEELNNRLFEAIKIGNIAQLKQALYARSCLAASFWEACPLEICEIIGQYGSDADPNGRDENSLSPLHRACFIEDDNCCENIVTLLLLSGADPLQNNGSLPILLHQAVKAGNLAMVKLLVERTNVDVNEKNLQGVTALSCAASLSVRYSQLFRHAGYKEGLARLKSMVEILLRAGANPLASDINGDTPFHTAARLGNSVMIQVLLDHHVDVDIKNNVGKTVLHYAVRPSEKPSSMSSDMSYYLASQGVRLEDYTRHKEVIELLLQAGADPMATDKEGHTPLYDAICYKNRTAVKLLIKKILLTNKGVSLSEEMQLETDPDIKDKLRRAELWLHGWWE